MPACKQDPEFTEKDIPDLTGYVAVITGGNGGIGYETTKQLALRGARVYIASRSEDKAQTAIEEINQSSAGKKLDVRFLQLDLQDLKSVKAAAAAFAQQESRLDILINNAGVMTVPFKLTMDGFETHWQVNYLAPFVLTTSLMPLLVSTASQSQSQNRVRVVNVSSDAAFLAGPKHIQLDDVNMTKAKGMSDLWQRYGHSKEASLRNAKELNDRYSSHGVTAYSVHPGIVRSNLQSHDPSLLGSAVRLATKFAARATPLEGALNSLFCATSPNAPSRGQGKYFIPVGKLDSRADTWLNDRDGNSQLWEHSEAELRSLG